VLTVAVWRALNPDSGASPAGPPVIAVLAQPAGASLRVLGVEDERAVVFGPADGTPLPVEPGRYRLDVSRDDCPDEWSREIDIAAGERLDFAPRICEGTGGLVVRSNLSGDRVQIDGLDVGTTSEQAHPVPVGDRRVVVQKSGYQSWSGTVRIRPDETTELLAELVPLAEPVASAPGAVPGGTGAEQAAAPRPPAPRGAEAGEGRLGGTVPNPDDHPTRSRTGQGGSKTWHDAIRDRLVGLYDRNSSGSLDTREEITSVPCQEWREIEASYETGGLAVPMTRLYGFDGSNAPAHTLGVTEGMRGYAYDRMKQCGLEANL